MGMDIYIVSQKKTENGWQNVEFLPFDWRSYGMFGFLADVQNFSAVPPISPARGLPDDFEDSETFVGLHGFSWLSISELQSFNYDVGFEDRRTMVETSPGRWNGAHQAKPGGGKKTTVREFLGTAFFKDLALAQAQGIDRIVFGFD